MKKLTICFASLLISFFGSTQSRVGIIGGYHQATASPAYYTPNEPAILSSKEAIKTGHVGINADISIKNNWFFQTGVLHFKRGQQQLLNIDTSQADMHFINARQELRYLDLPFSIVYKLKLAKNIRFIVGAGPQLSMFLKGTETTLSNKTITTPDTSYKVIKEEKAEDLLVGKGANRYKPSFISLNGFAGFELKNLYITANYSKGLTDYYDRTDEDFRHDSWGITAGLYIFRTKSEKQPKKEIDSDNDGIVDTQDECSTIAGPAITNGCPDKDGDGIADSKDACPEIAGIIKYNGCPIPDSDSDGVNDEEDKCPQQAGTKENNGCPVIEKKPEPEVIEQKVVEQVNMSAKQIAFKFGKATLTTESFAVLDEIVSLLKDTDVKIKVEGHSSLEGSPKINLKLSQDRADNVKNYLVSKGIAAERISSIGYGSTKPLANGATQKANIQNRRVEINIDK